MNLVWLTPQYLILGISEAFTMVCLQEFFYDRVPSGLRTTGLALFIIIFGIGSSLSSFLISVLEKGTSWHGHQSWFSDNLNKAHLIIFSGCLPDLVLLHLLLIYILQNPIFIIEEVVFKVASYHSLLNGCVESLWTVTI